MAKFSGKTALVTGAGSGIGHCISLQLAREGAYIVVVDLDKNAANLTLSKITANGGSGEILVCDISNNSDVTAFVKDLLEHRTIDILINNAGIAHIGNVENTTEADLDRIYSVNVKGVYNMLSAVVPAMKTRRHGVIINMASVASSVGIADRFAYSMSKGAVLSMTYSVAKDYIDYGIRCNSVSPARVHTPFVDDFLAKNYPDNSAEMFEKLSKSQPIGRMGMATEVASAVAYLCSDDAAFITGTNFPIDGGFVTLNN
jgi:2-keto-3-deoxy-L-fuconate dehydrogenase|tara:strand:- start:1678 stop:2451 length:774 start_codon:yes stop_codon:yes gene_type:complete